MQAMQEKIQRLCRYIETHCDLPLTLEALSRQVHVSRFHLQRCFKEIVGVTPRQYQQACRMKTFKTQLRGQDTRAVTQAIHDAGYGSSSRVYEHIDTQLGMTPRQYRKGGQGVEISHATADTPLGKLILAATDRGLCFVQFGSNRKALLAALQNEYPHACLKVMPPGSAQFSEWIRALNAYLTGMAAVPQLPLDLAGSVFQIKVWRYLQRIPHGTRQSYTQVARGIGHPQAARAVASACAANRLALLIPCHRVIRGDGALAGYRWGLERKQTLLEMERNSDRK